VDLVYNIDLDNGPATSFFFKLLTPIKVLKFSPFDYSERLK
jgi:hypothetical protein